MAKRKPTRKKGKLIRSDPLEIRVPLTGPVERAAIAPEHFDCCLPSPPHPLITFLEDNLRGNNLEIKIHALDPCGITEVWVYVYDLVAVTLEDGSTFQRPEAILLPDGGWIGEQKIYNPATKEVPPRTVFRIPVDHLWGRTFGIMVVVKTVCGREASVRRGNRALV